jgi:hypothetical protein
MQEPRKDEQVDDMDDTKRIMERLVKTPPDHKTGKGREPTPKKDSSDEKPKA